MITKEGPSVPEGQTVGKYLQTLREEKGLTYLEVTEATRISGTNLKALESCDYSKLPADTFVKGHLILYGNFLGQDGHQLATKYIAERNTVFKPARSKKGKLDDSTFNPKKFAEPSHVPPVTVAGIILALILISFTSFCLYTSWNPFSFLTDKTKHLSSRVMGVFQPAPEVVTTIIQGNSLDTLVTFSQDAEVKISIDEQAQDETIFAADQSAEWKADKQLRLEIAPPGSAEIQVNDKSIPFPEDHSGIFLFKLAAPPQ